MKSTVPFLALLLAAGCSRQPEAPEPDPHSTRTEPAAPTPLAWPGQAAPEEDSSAILVDVNGKTLPQKDAHREMELQIRSIRQPVPPHMLPQLRAEILRRVADQFVAKTLLVQEADKHGIQVSQEEINEAYAKIESRLPPGKTLQEMLQQNPMGEARMREDLVAGIKINKLLEPMATNTVILADQEVSEFYHSLRHARHILIKVNRGDDEAVKAEKKKQAEAIRAKLADGADFADMARRHSDCPSKQKGGDLGVFPRGKMAPDFEKAAFAQSPGELGPVVESPFGYHIIQVLELQKTEALAEDKVREQLTRKKRFSTIDAYLARLKREARIAYGPAYSSRPPPAPAPGMPPQGMPSPEIGTARDSGPGNPPAGKNQP